MQATAWRGDTEIPMRTARTRGALSTVRGALWVLSVCVLLSTDAANAADQGVTGKKLLLKGTRFVLLSKDASIHVSGSPACPAADSTLTFDDGVHSHTFALPCANWSDSGTVVRYKNTSAPGGPSEVRVANTKSGLVEVSGKGLGGFPVPSGLATIAVVFNLAGTIDRYCLSFSGVGDRNRFLVHNTGAGSCSECGNDAIDPGEMCDGTADAACPGNCQADCTCAAACPATQGDATACQAYETMPLCSSCCSADEECLSCIEASMLGCNQASENDACSLAINIVGCAAACCP
jgi:hypothetical protein